MAFSEKISIIVDVVTGSAQSSLSSFKTKLSEAEGGFAKLKVAGGQAFSAIASSPAALAGAAVAVGAFAAKSIAAFENTALAAGKFADTTGMSVDASSRLIEVAQSIGVSGETVSSAINKMNKAAQTTPQAFAAAGIEIAKTASGATDVQQTFLNAVNALNAIPDPAKRAAVAAQIFGKGWTSMAELIGLGSQKITDGMKAVSDAQAINADELAKARTYRDAMDALGDATQSLSIELGQRLVPAATSAANSLTGFVKVVGTVGDVIDALPDPGAGDGFFATVFRAAEDAVSPMSRLTHAFGMLGESSKDAGTKAEFVEDRLARFVPTVGTMADVTRDAADAEREAADQARELAAAVSESEAAATAATAAIEGMADAARASSDATFALSEAQDKLTAFVAEYDQAVGDAGGDQLKLNDIYRDGAKAALEVADATVRVADETAKANGQTVSGAQKIETFNKAALAQAATLKGPTQSALIDHIAQINRIPPEKVSEIKALIDKGQVAAAEAALNNASRTRNAALITQVLGVQAAENALQSLTRTRNAIINAQIVTKGGAGFNTSGLKAFAEGGEVPGPKGKAQLAVVHGGEQVISNKEQDEMSSRPGWSSWGAPGANVTINLPVGSDPTAVRRAFDRYALRNGSR